MLFMRLLGFFFLFGCFKLFKQFLFLCVRFHFQYYVVVCVLFSSQFSFYTPQRLFLSVVSVLLFIYLC